MTPQEINTVISEYCDGKCCHQNEEWEWVWNHPGGLFQGFLPYSDLNAMHEAEDMMLSDADSLENDMRQKRYRQALEEICKKAGWKYAYRTWHATAPQRAEAFLRAIGKWKE